MNSNIISEYINFSKQCINRYFKTILGKEYNKDIVNKLINSYIDSRYYTNSENLPLTIRTNLNEAAKDFKGIDLKLAHDVIKTFNFIMYFDNVIECESTVKVIEAIASFRVNVLGMKKDNKFNDSLFEMVKEDLIKKKEYLDTYDGDKFNFEYSLTNKDNVYNVHLKQNLKFPVVYNSTVIDRVFKSKELDNKRSLVEYNYTALQILRDIIQGKYYEYLISYPSSISQKVKNMEKLFIIINHEMMLNRITIKINYEDFIREKEYIYEYMRMGYMFAACIDNTFIENDTNLNFLKVFKYIIVSRRNNFMEINKYPNIIKVD